jgi:arylsulfatase A-like enzyme
MPIEASGDTKQNQDLHMNSLDYLPHTKKHLIDEGTLFKKHFCTIALCCPSRVSLWTGKAAHNTVRVPLSSNTTKTYADEHEECHRC